MATKTPMRTLDKDSSEYKMYGENFEKQYKIDIDELEKISANLDNKFQVLVNFTRYAESSNCDMLLFKNKLQRDLVDLQNELREAWNAIQILMNDRIKLRELFIAYQFRFEKLKEQIKKLAALLSERDAIIEKLNNLVKEQRVEIQHLRAELEKLREEYNLKMVEINKLIKEINELKSENERIKQMIEQLKLANERMAEEIEQLRSMLAEKLNELSSLMPQLTLERARNAELTAAIEQLKPEIEKLRKNISNIKQEYDTLLAENNKLRKSNEKIANEIEPIKNLYNELVNKFTLLQTENKRICDENDKLRSSVEIIIEKYKTSEDNKANYEKELQYFKEAGASEDDTDLKVENQRIFDDNKKLKEENRLFRNKNQKLLADVDDKKSEVDALRRQLEELLEAKRLKNEKRRKHKADKERDIEMVKKSMVDLRGDTAPPVEGPVALYRHHGDTAIVERHTKLKPFKEQEKTVEHHHIGHYITHPCPFCSVNGVAECPIHQSKGGISIQQALDYLGGDDEKNQMRGLLRLLEHVNDSARFKKILKERYGTINVSNIINTAEWQESMIQFYEESLKESDVPSDVVEDQK